jgi:hypothetical protein
MLMLGHDSELYRAAWRWPDRDELARLDLVLELGTDRLSTRPPSWPRRSIALPLSMRCGSETKVAA